MKKYALMLFVLLFTNFNLFSQDYEDHLFMYQGFIMPLHDSANQINLSLGYRYRQGVNADISYSLSPKYFSFVSIYGDMFSSNKEKSGFIFSRNNTSGFERYEYRVNKNNYSLSGGMGYYNNFGKGYFLASGGVSVNRIKDKIQFIKPKGKDITHTKVVYFSPFVQLSVIRRAKLIDFGVISRFAYNFYGKIKSYNTLFSNDYSESQYFLKKVFNLDCAVVLGVHIDRISIYTFGGLTRREFTNNFHTQLEDNFLLNVSLKYTFHYNKNKKL